MPAELTQEQINALKKALQERFTALLEETREELLKYDDERYQKIAGSVHDLEEESVADLLVDLNLADIDRHVNEIRDIEAALMRIGGGTYGVCEDCEAPIDYRRLQAYPTAKRCQPCQAQHEKTYAGAGQPKL